LPVDAVTLSCLATLASPQTPGLPLFDQLVVPLPGEIHITLRRCPGPLREAVQYVHRLFELGQIQDSMLQRGVDADLPDARSDAGIAFQSVGSSPC